VIEIVSESTRSKDADIKRKLYAKYGVREYWIVDPAAKTMEVLTWSETGFVSSGVYPHSATFSSPELPNLKLSLTRVF
jgi:Uma2 family endonuclease